MGSLPPQIGGDPETNRTLAREFTEVKDRLRVLEARFTKDGVLDMNGKRITNVGRTKSHHDVPGRGELVDAGLFVTNGVHTANSALVASEGIRSKHRARELDELVPLRQVLEIASTWRLGMVILTLPDGTSNDVELGAHGALFIVNGPTADYTITGLANTVEGRLIVLHNGAAVGMMMTLLSESTLSTDINRFALPDGVDMTIRYAGSVALVYNTSISRWVLAHSPF